MSRRLAFIAFLVAVIGASTSATPSFARVIHCGSISLDVPDTWRALDHRGTGGALVADVPDSNTRLGSWEALEAGESIGYLTAGVLNRSSLISRLAELGSRRELERQLRALSKVEDVRIRKFDTIEIDGVATYRARYTLVTKIGETIDQSLYIIGGSATCLLAFTRASTSATSDRDPFDEIARSARVHDRPRLLGLSRERSLWLLAALAGSSLLYHLARGVGARARLPQKVPVESRDD